MAPWATLWTSQQFLAGIAVCCVCAAVLFQIPRLQRTGGPGPNVAQGAITQTPSPLMRSYGCYTLCLFECVAGNINLNPGTALDGSHVFRHLLPDTLPNNL